MTKNSNKKYTNITLDKFTQNLLKIIPAKKEQEGVKKMEGNQPIYKVKVGGIEVAVWSNHGKNNGGFETVTMHRTYKDKNNNWQKTQALRTSDIPKAVLALQKAYEKIVIKE